MKIKKAGQPPENTTDRVFEQTSKPTDFTFNGEVATVFDDMVSRSVPYYDEMQRMSVELACDFARNNTNIYDIGCATGTTMALIDQRIPDINVTFKGIDNSSEMLKKAEDKLSKTGLIHDYDLECMDITKNLKIENASVVIMLLTLQFARPLYRERIVKNLCEGTNNDGCLILIEKVISEEKTFNRHFIDYYHEYKRRNGYSELAIAKKREALENVLIPYRLEENVMLLKDAGFRHVETFFRWYNFCGLIAMK